MELSQFSESRILNLIPDSILALDRDFVIRQCNHAACRMLGFRDPAELIGTPINHVLEESAFLRLRDGENTQCSEVIPFRNGEGLLECSCHCDEERSLFVCVLRSTTWPQLHGESEELLSRHLHAAALADSVCEKQLNIISQIASLLGETAVETQAAMQELKKTLLTNKAEKNG